MSIPVSQFIPSPLTPITISFFLYLWLFLFHKYVHMYHFLRFHLKVISYDICLSLSDWLHSVWQSLGPFMLLQMALFHFINFIYFIVEIILIRICTFLFSLCITEEIPSHCKKEKTKKAKLNTEMYVGYKYTFWNVVNLRTFTDSDLRWDKESFMEANKGWWLIFPMRKKLHYLDSLVEC